MIFTLNTKTGGKQKRHWHIILKVENLNSPRATDPVGLHLHPEQGKPH